MALSYGPRWTVLPDTYRYEPQHTPKILIQVESYGNDDLDKQSRQRIVLNGIEVTTASSGRSYRMTRLVPSSGGYAFHSTNGYDVYGSTVSAAAALTYLQTFNANDILVLNTADEPNLNRETFKAELENSFYAQLQSDPRWESRSSYVLVASKNKGVIFEELQARYDDRGVDATLYMGVHV